MLKIDVVIGNPPYNDRIDIEFFIYANKISNRYISFIHPLKWRSLQIERKAVEMQKIALHEGHLKQIVFFEATSHAQTSIWPDVQTGGINYWLMDLNNSFNYIDVSYQCSNKKLDSSLERYKYNRNRLYTFQYLLTNRYIQGIVEKVISSKNFVSIKDKFEDNSNGEVYIANTLFRAFAAGEQTDDSRLKGFQLKELNGLNVYMRTPFWRAITRQFKTGFHSYEQIIFNYIPYIDLVKENISEEYIEKLFDLNSEEIEYLAKFRKDIACLP